MLLMVLLFAPLTEEFIFRFWVTGKAYAYWVSIIGINIFTWLNLANVWISALVILVSLSYFFIHKRSKKDRITFFILFSSVFFAIIHYGNYNSGIISVFNLIYLFGGALILAYLGLRFGFIYAIIGHFVLNSIALCLMYYGNPAMKEDVYHFPDAVFEIEISHKHLFEKDKRNLRSDSLMSYSGVVRP